MVSNFDIKMMVKSSAIEINFKSTLDLVNLKGNIGVENKYNGTTFMSKMLIVRLEILFAYVIFRDIAGVMKESATYTQKAFPCNFFHKKLSFYDSQQLLYH